MRVKNTAGRARVMQLIEPTLRTIAFHSGQDTHVKATCLEWVGKPSILLRQSNLTGLVSQWGVQWQKQKGSFNFPMAIVAHRLGVIRLDVEKGQGHESTLILAQVYRNLILNEVSPCGIQLYTSRECCMAKIVILYFDLLQSVLVNMR